MTWRTRANGIVPEYFAVGRRSPDRFLWESGLHSPPPRQQDGYRVLNVDDPGGNLLATSVDPASPNPGGDYPPAYLTPDGRAFITSSTKIVPGDQATVITKIISLSTQTGRVQQVLYTASAHGHPQTYGNAGTLAEQGCAVLSLDPTGQHPLVQCFLFGRSTFGHPRKRPPQSTTGDPQHRPHPGMPHGVGHRSLVTTRALSPRGFLRPDHDMQRCSRR